MLPSTKLHLHYARLAALITVAATLAEDGRDLEAEQCLWIAIMSQINVFAAVKASGIPNPPKAFPSSSVADLRNKNWGSSEPVTKRQPSESTNSKSSSSSNYTKPNPTHNLPHEIITAIIQFVPAENLHECALVSRRWNNVTTPILYGNPILPTVTSISNFLCLMEQSKSSESIPGGLFVDHLQWKYHSLTKSITFSRIMASSNVSSLKTGDKDEEDRAVAKRSAIDDDIVKTQSCLFRLFVTDRMSTEWSFVHPIICQLVKACERLNEAHEYLSDAAEQMKKKKATRRRTTNGNGTGTGQWLGVNGEDDSEPIANSASQPIPANSLQQQQTNNTTTSSSSLPSLATSRAGTPIETLMDPDRLLTNLIRLCRRVINLCDSFGLSSDTVVDTLLLFLGIFESFETTFWKTTTGISYPCFQILKKTVFEKLRGILNAISTCILIEVQYITISSQKLLDSYCMLYYRALAHANAMNLSVVLDILQTAARELTASVNDSPQQTHHPYRTAKKPAHRILQAIQLMFQRNLFNLPRNHHRRQEQQQPDVHPDITLPPHQDTTQEPDPLFQNDTTTPDPLEEGENHQHQQQQHQDFDTLGGLLSSRTSLREGLMSFAPGSMNRETAEFIEEILETSDDLEIQLQGGFKISDATAAAAAAGDGGCSSSSSGSSSSYNPAREYEEAIEIAKCIRWMKEVVRWQKAGRQMEPVKDLLRKSMARIDRLRAVQRRYGLYFMD